MAIEPPKTVAVVKTPDQVRLRNVNRTLKPLTEKVAKLKTELAAARVEARALREERKTLRAKIKG